MNKFLNNKVWTFVGQEANKAINSRSQKDIMDVKQFFSAGRKFSPFYQSRKFQTNPSFITLKQKCTQLPPQYVINPFQALSHNMVLDLLTDSGTGTSTKQQLQFKQWYTENVPPIQINSYAGLTPKFHLNEIMKLVFGQNFNFYLALQGRAAQKLLLGGLAASKVITQGNSILSNRRFDTTKGQILKRGLSVQALNPIADPQHYMNSQSVFMGNLNIQKLESHVKESSKIILLTMTDNGSGGQPVSMKNLKEISKFAKLNRKILWIDSCRIFENALFIKAFQPQYSNSSIKDIVNEIASYADLMTISFKKTYSHSGGGILVNKNSELLKDKIYSIDRDIKNNTTANYGNGFDSYSGLTGQQMIDIISGIFCGLNQKIVAKRISQIGYTGLVLRQNYKLPIISGGHALYVAADKVLQNIPLQNCPAEYLNAILMNSIQVRGCGLGHIVYSKRINGKIVSNDLTMDSLRLAIPRQTYKNQQILQRLSLFGQAHKRGMFKNLKGGLIPKDYVDDGFYHFGAQYQLINKQEFKNVVNEIRNLTIY